MTSLLLLILAAPAPPDPIPPLPPRPDLEPLAARLLSADPAPAEFPAATEGLRDALRSVAIRWEIMDPREVRYVLTRDVDLPCDLKLLRRRYTELHDAPPLYDCMRFPDRSLVNDLLKFNRAYKTHLEARQSLELPNAWALHRAILETDELFAVWDLVRDTRCDYYFVTVRRAALKKLKAAIGDQNFYSGILPPHVPVWRFSRLD